MPRPSCPPEGLARYVELISVHDERTGDDTPFIPEGRLARLVAFVLCAQEVVPMGVSVSLVDEGEMHELNRTHMETDRPTDVLAFPLDDPSLAAQDPDHPHLLGDVVLAPAYIARQAQEHAKTTQVEGEMLTVHGTLHLLGYDHAEEEEAAVMFALTDELLAAWEEGSHG